MAEVVKMCDMNKLIAARVFKMLNGSKIRIDETHGYFNIIIITDDEPKDLIYPEGWYYGKGSFRNKHNSTTGVYDEIPMLKSNGKYWKDVAKYCTR